MSEILEKFLLISFGLMTLFLIMPIFAPLLENTMEQYQEREEEINIIDSDMRNLCNMLNYYSNLSSKENYTQNFEFEGRISCIIYNIALNSTVYRFCFYIETTKSPIYREIEINIIFIVSIESFFISQYSIQSKNISKFLLFF